VEPQLLADLASAVADGTPVDWEAAESGAASPAERELIAQLRLLAHVGGVVRAQEWSPDTGSPSPSSVEITTPSEAPTEPLTTPAPALGTWRHLQIKEPVGRGGFGSVYRARDPRLDKDVALKLIPIGDAVALHETAVIAEGRLLARVRHPNVVTIHGADVADGYLGLWMEFVRGHTLRHIVEKRGPFSPHEALVMGVEVARALAAVHAAGLVHRDVKAQNVMRDEGGRVVLMDFGAGEDTARGQSPRTAGTPAYMAPEVLEGGRATPRSDLYSLGVLLFYLVTGRHPVPGGSWTEVTAAHREGRRLLLRDLRPDIPVSFVRAVDALMAPDPSVRLRSAGAAEAALEQALVNRRHEGRRWKAVLAATVLAAGVALAVGLGTMGPWPWGGTAAVRTIAVMPLVNLSGDAGREYFVDGMTEQLIAELSRISALRVTDRTSVMGYKQSPKRLSDIADELGVETVLEGSVVLAGTDLRLTAALIRAADGLRLWSQSYERSVNDAFALQAELARDLAASIELALTPEERRDLEQAFQASPEAQDLYLKGRAVLYRFDRSLQQEACRLLERAVELEPRYALAWASLSRCYGLMEVNGVWSPAVAGPKVKEAAGRAIAEDESLADAHLAMADARFRYDWDWRGARESYEQAVAFNPSFSLGRGNYARFLAAAGHTDEAFEQVRRAVESDPQTADTRRTLGLILFYQRRYDEALARTDEATTLNLSFPGSHVVRARALSALLRHDEAIAAMEQAMSVSNDPAQLAELGRIYAHAGRRDEALAILDRLMGPDGPDGFIHTQDAGYLLAALGRADEALDRLERAVDDRSSRMLWLRVDPRVDMLRTHPRFQALLARIGGLD
jgi:TolB-like protein/Tfp pilus assembly protein PilF